MELVKKYPIVTPYNTGKMQIGCHYVEFKPHPITRDGALLQRALLNDKRNATERNEALADKIVWYSICAIAIGLPLCAYLFDIKLGG